ncbi:phosphoesterase family-domain-containing protein [Apodospora peruviana]|uniref:Phosphoesterase family-domain-containing protein n=1 Tax=Apodospora peruviana TaxID=516989 RepID=A0AAE0HS25_9PEZI|nr:phosphoesterase family-domain-containing protein [Apodospora peruviana]KAK3319147.1 phosphoesterase family-domain-containing protein [Apodospora peruviana]
MARLSLLFLSLLGGAAAQLQYTSTASSAVAAARATALTLSPTSNVVGKTFDRFVQIFLENQDYSAAIANSNLAYLATQGISLTQYYGVTHPSQPNYVGAAGATRNGITTNDFSRLATSVKSVVDLLEAKGISWGVYQEDMPYSGFEGNYKNQATGADDYVRKHNPLMSYDSVTSDVNRLAKCKNFTMFNRDLANNKLPQWMFITPNMTNSGHDSSLAAAATWSNNWITPLLANPNFNINRTLVILTFDEGTTTGTNRVYAVLLGSAIPTAKKGTTNSTTYNHYSLVKTVEVNWSLGNLGTNDISANAFF